MSCEYCGLDSGHDFRCPNYMTPKTTYYCSSCGEPILNEEEYVMNYDGEYAHWDCVWYGRELAAFLGVEINRMEDLNE